jgi:hypothetical protein
MATVSSGEFSGTATRRIPSANSVARHHGGRSTVRASRKYP